MPSETAYGPVGLDFATALSRGEYERARDLLSPKLAAEYSAEALEREYEEMISYGEGPVTLVELMNGLDSWPTKQAGDVGWAYVSMSGDSFGEAVAVVVAEYEGRLLIREIEWGRP